MVQETFLRLLQGDFNYENEEKAKAWLIVTASNCCKSQLRRCWRKKQVAFDAVVHDKGTEQTDNLLLRMEIAGMLRVNASTVRSRLAKARKILRLQLEAEEAAEEELGERRGNAQTNIRKAW